MGAVITFLHTPQLNSFSAFSCSLTCRQYTSRQDRRRIRPEAAAAEPQTRQLHAFAL